MRYCCASYARACTLKSARIEWWYDAAEREDDGAEYARGFDAATEELQPYREAWETLFLQWEDTLASGHWPGADPRDESLQVAMCDDMQRGSEAIEAGREILYTLQSWYDAREAGCEPDGLSAAEVATIALAKLRAVVGAEE